MLNKHERKNRLDAPLIAGEAEEFEDLIDVTRQATRTDDGMLGGFDWLRRPVYITPGVDKLTDVPDGNTWEDKRGRLHDVLWMGSLAARRLNGWPSRDFELLMSGKLVRLNVEIHQGGVIISNPADYQGKS